MQCVPKQPLASFESWLVRNMAKVTFLSVYELNTNIEKTCLYFSTPIRLLFILIGWVIPPKIEKLNSAFVPTCYVAATLHLEAWKSLLRIMQATCTALHSSWSLLSLLLLLSFSSTSLYKHSNLGDIIWNKVCYVYIDGAV